VPAVTLETLTNVSQSIASFAVVGSMIYLALQVRFAERSQRGLMQQSRADRAASASLGMAEAAAARIWMKGCAGDSDFDPVEFTQWMLLARAAFLSGEDSVLQYRAGLLSQNTFGTYVAGASHYLAMPGFRAAWKVQRSQFGSEFRSFADQLLRDHPVRPVGDGLGEWNRLVAMEKGGADPSPGLVGPV
jgi:hypothetical protein